MASLISITTKSEKPLLLNFGADEIPLVLLESNESALVYIQQEQFENASLLLQKAH
jgi:PHD/YefM family antitoxin component YafN of YafNO toxin-antitoxin module